MSDSARLQMLRDWRSSMRAMDAAWSEFHKSTGASMDGGTLGLAVGDLMSHYTKCAAAAVGDEHEWLEWWWLECGLGDHPKVVEFDERGQRIKLRVCTVSDLLRVVEMGEAVA